MCHDLQLKGERADRLEGNLDRAETIYKSHQVYGTDASPGPKSRRIRLLFSYLLLFMLFFDQTQIKHLVEAITRLLSNMAWH